MKSKEKIKGKIENGKGSSIRGYTYLGKDVRYLEEVTRYIINVLILIKLIHRS